MDLDYTVVPIRQWPGPQAVDRKRHPFRKMVRHRYSGGAPGYYASSEHGVDWSSTTTLLSREIRALGGENVIMQLAVRDRDIRLDGHVRANARPAEHPGVILTFDSKYGALSYPCDMFTDWQANVRAIALALEALRKVDRYGVTKRGEQYTGWKQLSASHDGGPHKTLAMHSGLSEAEVRADPKAAYRKAARTAHPDKGGDDGTFAEVSAAARLLGVA